ncbi:unnamed protein product, partial [Discosporangium mesarthrocarpum]
VRQYTLESGLVIRVHFILVPGAERLYANVVQHFCSGTAGVAVMSGLARRESTNHSNGDNIVSEAMEWEYRLRPARIPCKILVLLGVPDTEELGEVQSWARTSGFQIVKANTV